MYENYFHFSENPFTIAPNPRYLYLTLQHREALAHLTYGLKESGGFILLTGEVGTGKTTVCRCLLERVPDDVHVAMILTPTLGSNELLEAICDEFGVRYVKGATVKQLTDALNHYLLDAHAKGQRAVVVIDEVQNLSVEVLEQLRLLTNLETNEQKLLQIILIGQPEFLTKLDRPELRQLSQRIVARYHMVPLKTGEVRAYIHHRLKVVGGSPVIFRDTVTMRIAQLSKGVPRLINLLCDRALLGCYVQEKREVDMRTLEKAAREVIGDRKLLGRRKKHARAARVGRPHRRWLLLPASIAVAVAVSALLVPMNMPQFTFEVPLLFEWLKRGKDVNNVAVAPPLSEPPPSASPEKAVAWLPEVPAPTPLTWEAFVDAEHSKAGAYIALFERWDMQYSLDAQTPCGFALRHWIDCWHTNGDFSDLRRLNRPVLLKMVTEHGHLFYAALLEIDGDRARLGHGKREIEVPITEVEKYWTEELTLLWRRPPKFVRTLRPGDKGDFVAWVEDKIFQIDGRKVANSGPKQGYDFALSSRVRSLQRRCGLRVDGLVGRKTIIMINTLTATVPVLSKKPNRRCMRRLNV